MHQWLLLVPWSAAGPASAAELPFSTRGCAALRTLSELRFTFNVEIGGEVRTSRTWRYVPRTGELERWQEGRSTSLVFGSPAGQAQTRADAQFVNDFFWLLPTCHIAWASDRTIGPVEEDTLPVAPVGEAPGRAPRVTVTYAEDGGGYTPGDAYDLFLGEQGRLVAWTYRRKNASEPTLSVTFDDYRTFGPLEIATEHVSADREFRLTFSDVSVTR